jgi:S1-C subfamily serine protease
VEIGSTSWGTGTCVASTTESLIITANHVIQDGHLFKINGKPVKLVGSNKIWDLAALIAPSKFPTYNISTNRPKIGDPLTVCGFGSGDYKESSGILVKYVSPLGDWPSDMLECTAKARQGDSGGPIFDEHGTLVAVLFGTDDVGAHGSCTVQVRKFIETLNIDDELKERALTIPYIFYGKPR